MKKIIIFLLASLLTINVFAKQTSLKSNSLTVIIKKPIAEVFKFTIDPKNTSKWVNGIKIEETNEWPPRIGTIYQNRGSIGSWNVYKVSKYQINKEFELIKQDNSTYHVNYSYFSLPNKSTKLVYHEWVTTGTIASPMTQNEMNRLKEVITEN